MLSARLNLFLLIACPITAQPDLGLGGATIDGFGSSWAGAEPVKVSARVAAPTGGQYRWLFLEVFPKDEAIAGEIRKLDMEIARLAGTVSSHAKSRARIEKRIRRLSRKRDNRVLTLLTESTAHAISKANRGDGASHQKWQARVRQRQLILECTSVTARINGLFDWLYRRQQDQTEDIAGQFTLDKNSPQSAWFVPKNPAFGLLAVGYCLDADDGEIRYYGFTKRRQTVLGIVPEVLPDLCLGQEAGFRFRILPARAAAGLRVSVSLDTVSGSASRLILENQGLVNAAGQPIDHHGRFELSLSADAVQPSHTVGDERIALLLTGRNAGGAVETRCRAFFYNTVYQLQLAPFSAVQAGEMRPAFFTLLPKNDSLLTHWRLSGQGGAAVFACSNGRTFTCNAGEGSLEIRGTEVSQCVGDLVLEGALASSPDHVCIRRPLTVVRLGIDMTHSVVGIERRDMVVDQHISEKAVPVRFHVEPSGFPVIAKISDGGLDQGEAYFVETGNTSFAVDENHEQAHVIGRHAGRERGLNITLCIPDEEEDPPPIEPPSPPIVPPVDFSVRPLVILFLIDGARFTLLERAIKMGVADNFARIMGTIRHDPGLLRGEREHGPFDWGASDRAISRVKVRATFPTITISSFASMITGQPPSVTGVSSNQFFDRLTYGSKGLRAYCPITLINSLWSFENTIVVETLGPLVAGQRLSRIFSSTENDPVNAVANRALLPGTDLVYNHVTRTGGISAVLGHMYWFGVGSEARDSYILRDDIDNYLRLIRAALRGGGGHVTGGIEVDLLNMEEAIRRIRRESNDRNAFQWPGRPALPDLLSVYLLGLDHALHERGPGADSLDAITRWDHWLAGMIETLEEQDLWRDTVFLFVSDHGYNRTVKDKNHALSLADTNDLRAPLQAAGRQVMTSWRQADRDDFDTVVTGTGTMAQIYLKHRTGGWKRVPEQHEVGNVARNFFNASAEGFRSGHEYIPKGSISMVLARLPERGTAGRHFQDLETAGTLPEYSVAVFTRFGLQFASIRNFLDSTVVGRRLKNSGELDDFERRIALLNSHRSGDVLLLTAFPDPGLDYADYLDDRRFPFFARYGDVSDEDERGPFLFSDGVIDRARNRRHYMSGEFLTNHGSANRADTFVTFVIATPGNPESVLSGSVRRAVEAGIRGSIYPGSTLDLVPILKNILRAQRD